MFIPHAPPPQVESLDNSTLLELRDLCERVARSS